MFNFENVLTKDEIAVFSLRKLYSEYGYSQYKMSKFEEYDLYVDKKDFLVSNNIIAFTDTDGRLLALKPDVTLSIIKNSKDMGSGLIKAQYNENVYRTSSGTHTFKELMQVGLECIGNVTDKEIIEVITLAKKSLDTISKANVLEISNLDIPNEVISFFEVSSAAKKEILKYLSDKNADAIEKICINEGISREGIEAIRKLAEIYGSPIDLIDKLDVFKLNDATASAVDTLKSLIDSLSKNGEIDGICVDFSLVGNMKYYNGIAIRGFIKGIPTGILSGGQYDNLMQRMGKSARAIGFAVYLDGLDRLPCTDSYKEGV